jgi:hypothetical protein
MIRIMMSGVFSSLYLPEAPDQKWLHMDYNAHEKED